MGRAVDSLYSINKNVEASDMFEQIIIPQQNSERIVFLSGEVNELSIAQTITQLLSLAQHNTKPINLIVSTYGGSVDEMFSLYDVIKSLPCPVHTIGLGKVMSAGVLLLSCGEKGKRLIGKSARIMMHPISSMLAGNIFELNNEAAEVQRMQNLMIEALSFESKMSKEQIQKIMKNGHDTFITPSEAIEFGIVDRIIGDNKQ
jgi:ATP-dependent Clp protease protease subunit